MAPGTRPHVARNVQPPSASSSSKKRRGKNRGLTAEAAYTANGKNKLVIIIPKEVRAPIGIHATKFATYLGTVIRHMAPVEDVNVWTEIDAATQAPIIQAVRNKFEIVDYDNESEAHVKEVVHSKCYQLYKSWRSRMKSYYLSLLDGGHDPYNFPFQDMDAAKWNYMIDNVWSSEKHKKVAAKNKINKGKQLYGHTMGSKSFAVAMSEEPDNTFGNFYEKSHKHKETKVWISPICAEKHAEMTELENKSNQEGAIPLSNEEISQLVLGKKSGYLRGFGIGPKPSSSVPSFNSSNAREEEVNHMKEELTVLREKTSSQAEQISSQAEQINAQAKQIQELYSMCKTNGTSSSTLNSSTTNFNGFMDILMDD